MLERDVAGVHAEAALDLNVQGTTTHFDMSGLYRAASRTLGLEVAFAGLNPAVFAQATPQLAPLEHLALPFAGKVSAEIGIDGALDLLHFDVTAGEGRLVLPDLYPEDLAVKSLAAKGTLSEHGTALAVEEANVDLGGATFTFSGTARGLDGNSQVALELTGMNVKVDDLPSLWPASIAPNPRRWITDNLSSGTVDTLYVSLLAHGSGLDPQTLETDRIDGTMRLSGINVRYLGKMPKVRGTAGTVRFDEKSFNISIDKGSVQGIGIDAGTIAITGLDLHDQYIAIDLSLHGALRSMLQLVDDEPLRYAAALGIDPKKVSGDAAVRLAFKFELINQLRFPQIDVHAAADMKDVALASIFLGHDMSHGNLALKVGKEGMEIGGTAVLGAVPVTLSWSETFGQSPERRMRLAGVLDDSARKALGLDTGEFLSGPVPLELELRRAARRPADIDLSLDLAKATLAFPRVDWRKPPGIAGKAHVRLVLDDDKISAVPDFSIEAGDLSAHGEARFAADSGRFQALRFDRLALGRDRLSGAVTRRTDGVYAIELNGEALDAAALLNAKGGGTNERGPALAVKLAVKKLWLSHAPAPPLGAVAGTIELDGSRVARAALDARTAGGAPFHLGIVPAAGKRNVILSCADAGELLKAVDFADNVVGGKLALSGTADDTKAESPLAGTVRVADFKVLQAPTLAKLLTLASLTGIGDRLAGKGIHFNSLLASFAKTGDRIEFRDGRTAGSELGVTFGGWLDLGSDKLAIDGTIVPVYSLNSILGNIPGLNDILVGPKGGGVFAATYRASGNLSDPDVTVNALSVLAPGILRGIIDLIFPGGSTVPPTEPYENPFRGSQ